MHRFLISLVLGVVLESAARAEIIPPSTDTQNAGPGAELAAKSRPRVTIYPRHLGPSAKRICQSWLATEYRVSGPVIVPQMRCRWE